MKKKIFTFCLIFVLFAVSFAAGFSVTKSQAIVPLGFGGMLLDWEICDCSYSFWLFYAPIGVPSPFPGGPLGYSPYDTVTYSYYDMLDPGVWHLGMYLPFVQTCWVFDGFGCFPLPVLGHEIMVGTSLKPDDSSASDTSANTLNQMGGTQPYLDSGMQLPAVNVI